MITTKKEYLDKIEAIADCRKYLGLIRQFPLKQAYVQTAIDAGLQRMISSLDKECQQFCMAENNDAFRV